VTLTEQLALDCVNPANSISFPLFVIVTLSDERGSIDPSE